MQVLELRGDSFQHFGNAAIVQSIVDRLPEIAKEIAAPLAKTEKVRNLFRQASPGSPDLAIVFVKWTHESNTDTRDRFVVCVDGSSFYPESPAKSIRFLAPTPQLQ